MTRKTHTDPMLRGSATHRRTQGDYLRTLLDRVTLETWGDVIDATVAKAKEGDATARTFLAAYLVGRPTMEAPKPLHVMAQALAGDDPLASALAETIVHRIKYGGDQLRETMAAAIANELPAHIRGEL